MVLQQNWKRKEYAKIILENGIAIVGYYFFNWSASFLLIFLLLDFIGIGVLNGYKRAAIIKQQAVKRPKYDVIQLTQLVVMIALSIVWLCFISKENYYSELRRDFWVLLILPLNYVLEYRMEFLKGMLYKIFNCTILDRVNRMRYYMYLILLIIWLFVLPIKTGVVVFFVSKTVVDVSLFVLLIKRTEEKWKIKS